MRIRYGSILKTPAVLSGLYLLAVMPRMTNRADPAPFKTRFFAHRGLHDNGTDAPENSMAAFRKAVESGFGIELDVQLTADLVPVIFHDPDLLRVCGVNRQVRDCTYEQLQEYKLFGSNERIPTLREFLEMVDGRVPLIVEFKSEDTDMTLCRIIDPMLKAYKGVYCIESFNPSFLVQDPSSGSNERAAFRRLSPYPQVQDVSESAGHNICPVSDTKLLVKT